MMDEHDLSFLDARYFVDEETYNCPFCRRRNVKYTLVRTGEFDWNQTKKCHSYEVLCSSCKRSSLHLSFKPIHHTTHSGTKFTAGSAIDKHIFHSMPSSSFVLDPNVPKELRDLVKEAQGCLLMNYLVGSSACMRKCIYELVSRHKGEGDNAQKKIKSLKQKLPNVDPKVFDVLGELQWLASDPLHEESWKEWDSGHLRLMIEAVKEILYEVYVYPAVKKQRLQGIDTLRDRLREHKKSRAAGELEVVEISPETEAKGESTEDD